MMNKRNDILLSPGFLAGLLLLLANDFFFKDYFHNALTGKLSDIAGLFIFPLFISAILRSQSKHIFYGVALFFVYWKSPLSDPLLNALSFLSGLNFERVVDYTDLFCLPVLGFSYRYLKNDRRQVNFSRTVILLCSAFAFMATSKRKMPIVVESEMKSLTSGYRYQEVSLKKEHIIPSDRFNRVFVSGDSLFHALYCEGDTIIAYLGEYPFGSRCHTVDWPAFYVLKDLKNGNLRLLRLFVPGDKIPEEQPWFDHLDTEISGRLLKLRMSREQEEKIQMWINRAKRNDRIAMKMLDSLIAHCSPERLSLLQVYEKKADYLIRNYKPEHKKGILKLFDRQDSLDKVCNRSEMSVKRYSKRLDFCDRVHEDSLKEADSHHNKFH